MGAANARYVAHVRVALGNTSNLRITAPVEIVSQPDLQVTVYLENKAAEQNAELDQRLLFQVAGFDRESEARDAGRRWTTALLWASISLRVPTSVLSGSEGKIVDRRKGDVHGTGLVTNKTEPHSWAKEALAYWSRPNELNDDRLRLALELFCAAQLERSARAKLVAMMSAIEPLIDRKAYPEGIVAKYNSFVEGIIASLRDGTIEESVRDSISGRARDLRQESISAALKRTVAQILPGDSDSLRAIEDAYDARSKLVHRGEYTGDIESLIASSETAIRRICAHFLSLPLAVRT
jgi:hypothetical protein